MLKAKVKRLESVVSSAGLGADSLAGGVSTISAVTGTVGMGGGGRTVNTLGGTTAASLSRRSNVDTQAEEELTYMSSVRVPLVPHT